MKKFITYYRVSTKEQGKSGNGLEAQRTTAEGFIKSRGAKEIASFTEVESGRKKDRPILKTAIEKCKEEGADLLIAKLDRLTRNVGFLFMLDEELKQAGVGFVAADLPDANTMTLGVMASVAQYEAERTSQRIKEAMAEVKKKGEKRIGSPENLTDEARQKAWATTSRKARTDKSTRHAYHFIRPLREAGETYQAIAEQLNDEGYRTRRGKRFHPAQVHKIYNRFAD